MRHAAIVLLILVAINKLMAAPPAPPANPSNPLLPAQVPIRITNVMDVYTNVALKSPTLDFQDVTLYDASNTCKGMLLISWTANSEPELAGYRVYFGPINTNQTNKYTVKKHVNTVMFSSMFNTNNVYWFCITAFDGDGLESPPSSVVIAPVR